MYLSWNTFFLHFYAAKIQNGYHGWTNCKIIIYFELYMGRGSGFLSSLCNLFTVSGLSHLSPLSEKLHVFVGVVYCLIFFLYVSCSSINQVVKHLRIQWKHSWVYACHRDIGLPGPKCADQMGTNLALFPVTYDSCLTTMIWLVYKAAVQIK